MNNIYKAHKNFIEFKDKHKKNIELRYDSIYEYYNQMKDLNIDVERICIEKKLNKYKGITTSYYSNILIILLTVFCGSMFKNDIVSNAFLFFGLMIIIIMVASLKRKEIEIEDDEVLYLNMCLMILDKIESNKK